MPFPFQLPTTSSVPLNAFLESRSHPSLVIVATSKRSVVRDALKRHKRLAQNDQAANLASVHDALYAYAPYLLCLSAGSSHRDVGQQRVEVEIKKPLEVEWRTTITASMPGREPTRPKLIGLHHEIAFVLSTLAYVQTLTARAHLRILYDATVVSTEQRVAIVSAAMRDLLEALGIYQYLLTIPSVSAAADVPLDVQPSTLSALASLALAEATLAVIGKDDPYAIAVADDRNDNNTDWMYKAPDIPKTRASLYARICLAAAEHAGQAHGSLSRSPAGKPSEDLLKYVFDLRRTAKAKALRFSGVASELSGKTGEALAWLNAAKRELGLTSELEDGKRKGFRGLRQNWQERREDRKVEKGAAWGMDAGRLEEARIVEMLEAKWDRENSTINIQVVPPVEPLLLTLPSGREYHNPQPWIPPTLQASELASLRMVSDSIDVFHGDEEDSGEERDYTRLPVGAFPQDDHQADRKTASNAYF